MRLEWAEREVLLAEMPELELERDSLGWFAGLKPEIPEMGPGVVAQKKQVALPPTAWEESTVERKDSGGAPPAPTASDMLMALANAASREARRMGL